MSRDRTVGDTFFIAFTTRAFATGIPTVLAGTPVVSAYEDAGLTQITAGITLGVDHDSVVGMNMLTIVATGANGFESGKDYNLAITTGTVGGVSVVGEIIGQFSLGLSAAAVDLANGTDGLTALKSDTAATLTDTAEIGTAGAGLTDLGGMSTGMKAEVNAEADTALTDYDGPTNTEMEARTLISASYFDPTADAVANVTLCATTTTNTDMVGTDSAALASVCTETRLAELDAGNLPTDIAAIPTTAMRGTDSALLAASINLTGGAVDTVTTVTNQVTVSDILTTQMTEAYAADGTAPTLAQALFLIQQTIGDFAIAGTTITTKKLDGSTTAATYTLDDGTNPTSRTRTT